MTDAQILLELQELDLALERGKKTLADLPELRELAQKRAAYRNGRNRTIGRYGCYVSVVAFVCRACLGKGLLSVSCRHRTLYLRCSS